MEKYNPDTVLKDTGFTVEQADYARRLIAARPIHRARRRETEFKLLNCLYLNILSDLVPSW